MFTILIQYEAAMTHLINSMYSGRTKTLTNVKLGQVFSNSPVLPNMKKGHYKIIINIYPSNDLIK